METLLGLLALLALPLGYVVLQARAIRAWPGAWRWAALVPVAGWLLWLASLVHDLARDPTARNLFPLEALLGIAMALGWLGLLALSRRIARRLGPRAA